MAPMVEQRPLDRAQDESITGADAGPIAERARPRHTPPDVCDDLTSSDIATLLNRIENNSSLVRIIADIVGQCVGAVTSPYTTIG
ncbi:hypothetical protein EVAR_77354_1 [Eumeta japonica]|uniref:Uncharacterized protein n=1 Tax=Eumeta variegata TaxID=151549 RepID=A0A4C1UXQ4_EUMVA|nr:hypothetical protein EVAR_77354_1 [Eumeta japonica]